MICRTGLMYLMLAALLIGCGQNSDALVIYSGRSKALVEPILNQFQENSGIPVEVRYGETAQLAVAMGEEGDRTEADVFWAQDAGALGAADDAGLFAQIPDSILSLLPDQFRNDAGTWVATSGRARTLAYSSERVDSSALPRSIFELTEEQYSGRVGWAPTNGSFQAHVTALRQLAGDDSARAWLRGMIDNGAKSYRNNTAIIQAIAAGEVDLGLPNHYYLYRFKNEDAKYPVEQGFFEPGNPGNLINVAGAGVLDGSEKKEQAFALIHFLLSREAQEYFARETFEYPVANGVDAPVRLPELGRLDRVAPNVDLNALRDLEGTLQMLRDVGLL